MDSDDERLTRIVDNLALLPPCNLICVALITNLCYEIHKNREINKMPASSMAIILGPSFMRPQASTNDFKNPKDVLRALSKETENLKTAIALMEGIIEIYPKIAHLLEQKLQSMHSEPKTPGRNSSIGSPATPKKEGKLKEGKSQTKPKSKLSADDPERVIMPADHECLTNISAILASPPAAECFMKYLATRELSDENLLFYYEVDKYNALTTKEERVKLLRQLLKNFIVDNAPTQVNIDISAKRKIEEAFANCEADEDDLKDLFIDAQSSVLRLMEEHSYPRFLQSQDCRQLLKGLEGGSGKKKK